MRPRARTHAGTRALRSADPTPDHAPVQAPDDAPTDAPADRVLVLFDIDGTLLTGDGAGFRAMQRAGESLFGAGFSSAGVAYAGRLDPLIVGELLCRNGIPDTPGAHSRFRRAYAEALSGALRERPVTRLPGALELARALSASPRAVTGLLTGNYRETGEMKLASAGLPMSLFDIHVWGDDAPGSPPHRDQLPPVARDRAREAGHRVNTPEHVVIIGDTPGDVRCAAAHGHRSLAVTTGRYGHDELSRSGASRVVSGLDDTAGLAEWICSER